MAVVAVKTRHKPPAGHPHVKVVSSAGSVTLGTTDEKVEYDGLGSTWVEVDRPGDNSLARRAKRNRLKATVTAMLIDGMNGKTVFEQIKALDLIGASSATCGVSYAEMANHRWILTEAKPSTIDRRPVTNALKHADITLTFLVAVDEQTTVAVSRKKNQPSDKGAGKRRTYVVRKGDTLTKIAAKVYGNANRWHEIAKLNGIRAPHRPLKVGRKLKV
jgi:LysM domain-containing protein